MPAKKKDVTIYIDETLCKGCSICVELCGKKVFAVSEKINRLGYYVPIPVNAGECTACMICDLICPEFAVVIDVKEKDEVT